MKKTSYNELSKENKLKLKELNKLIIKDLKSKNGLLGDEGKDFLKYFENMNVEEDSNEEKEIIEISDEEDANIEVEKRKYDEIQNKDENERGEKTEDIKEIKKQKTKENRLEEVIEYISSTKFDESRLTEVSYKIVNYELFPFVNIIFKKMISNYKSSGQPLALKINYYFKELIRTFSEYDKIYACYSILINDDTIYYPYSVGYNVDKETMEKEIESYKKIEKKYENINIVEFYDKLLNSSNKLSEKQQNFTKEYKYMLNTLYNKMYLGIHLGNKNDVYPNNLFNNIIQQANLSEKNGIYERFLNRLGYEAEVGRDFYNLFYIISYYIFYNESLFDSREIAYIIFFLLETVDNNRWNNAQAISKIIFYNIYNEEQKDEKSYINSNFGKILEKFKKKKLKITNYDSMDFNVNNIEQLIIFHFFVFCSFNYFSGYKNGMNDKQYELIDKIYEELEEEELIIIFTIIRNLAALSIYKTFPFKAIKNIKFKNINYEDFIKNVFKI